MAEATLSKMTTEERHSLMQGVGWEVGQEFMGMGKVSAGFYMGTTRAIKRLGIPALKIHDAGNGFRNNPMPDWNASSHGFGTTTCWPSALAMASSWDEDLVRRVAAATAGEFKAKGANILLGPGIQVHRVARNGRNFEYLSGEDPYLGARLAAAYVEGAQSEGVVACAKHWAFNEQETHRFASSSQVDERTAWELYYPPFEAAVEAGVGSIMCGYNRVNGTFACENEALLKRDLKERMGFRGFVMSDWWATHTTSVAHGLDQEMPGTGMGPWYMRHGPHFTPQELAYNEQPETRPWYSRWHHWINWKILHRWLGPHGFSGSSGNVATAASLPEAEVAAVFREPARRILAATYRQRLEESPGCEPGSAECKQLLLARTTTEQIEELNREAAVRSVVLLKNDGVLPINPDRFKKVAIMGNALTSESKHLSEHFMPPPDFYSGGGSGHVGAESTTLIPPLPALRRRAEAAGLEVLTSNCTGAGICGENLTREEGNAGAVALAREADVVIFVAAATATEGEDRPHLRLDDDSYLDDAIAAVAAERPTIVLLQVPGAILTPWRDEVAAVACVFLAGEQTSSAWASIVFGDESPSGKLPIVLPKSEQATIPPTVEGWIVPYSEGVFTSYRAPTAAEDAAFPFGHGLSYTTFTYTDIAVVEVEKCDGAKASILRPREVVACVQATVVNEGERSGAEVAQAYLEFPNQADQPRKSLHGMARTSVLARGEAEVVFFSFTRRDLSLFLHGAWRPVELGDVVVHVGSSSADIWMSIALGPSSSSSSSSSSASSASSASSPTAGELDAEGGAGAGAGAARGEEL